MKILIIDDEIELVETLVERLIIRGVDAKGTCDTCEAMDVVRSGDFDIILLDVKMPGVNGLQLLKIIKSELPKQKVILMTGHGSREDAEEGIRWGAYDYLMKPVQIEHLLSILQRATKTESENGT